MRRRWQRKLPLTAALCVGIIVIALAAFFYPGWAAGAHAQELRAQAPGAALRLAAATSEAPVGQPDAPGRPAAKKPKPTTPPATTPPPTTPPATTPPPTTPPPTTPPPTTPPTPDPNQIANGDFESCLAGWSLVANTGAITCEVDGTRNGANNHVAKLFAASATNVALSSNYFSVAPNSFVDASAWLRWSGVAGGTGLRMNLYAYDANKTTIVKSWEFFSVNGDWANWKKMGWFVLAPPGTVYMQLRIQFSGAAGSAWIDDAYARVIAVPTVDPVAVSSPAIVPRPWQMRAGGTAPALGNTAIVYPDGESRLAAAVDAYWTALGLQHTLIPASQASNTSGYAVVARFGDRNTPEIAAALQAGFPGASWDALGKEGYFLHAGQATSGQVQIYGGANAENGRFYALQSLKQVSKKPAAGSPFVYTLDVLDVNTVARRGITMSLARFSDYTGNLQKIAGYKMNYVWNQGHFLNDKFEYAWRTPLTSAEQTTVRDYLAQANNNFVTPWISLAPRASSATGAVTCYASDTDINAAVDKMDMLYGLGLRNFGLDFDDLQNVGQDVLSCAADKQMFGSDLGKAHLYFVNAVYDRLTARHPDIQGFTLLPWQCYQAGNFGPAQQAYLAQMQNLRPQIGINSVQYYDADYLEQMRMTGRPTASWSNFYAEGYTASGLTYVVPHINLFNASNSAVTSAITGLSFLPLQPADEDAGQISWTTTADYFWAPDRYDPQRSFQLGAAKYAGK